MKKSKYKKMCVDLAECLQRQSLEHDHLIQINLKIAGENERLYSEINAINKQLIEESNQNSRLQCELSTMPLQPMCNLHHRCTNSEWIRLQSVFINCRNRDRDNDIRDAQICAFLNQMIEETK